MKQIETKQVWILRESVIESWLTDGVTFGMLFLMYYLNHSYTGGSVIIDLTISFAWVVLLLGKIGKHREVITREQAIEKLKSMK